MKAFKRYTPMNDDSSGPVCFIDSDEDPNGAWVRYDDVLAAIKSLQADAHRYRWLRATNWSGELCVVSEPKKAVRLGSFCPSRENLDAAIDEAMKESEAERYACEAEEYNDRKREG
jgi:hypothetical protein